MPPPPLPRTVRLRAPLLPDAVPPGLPHGKQLDVELEVGVRRNAAFGGTAVGDVASALEGGALADAHLFKACGYTERVISYRRDAFRALKRCGHLLLDSRGGVDIFGQ